MPVVAGKTCQSGIKDNGVNGKSLPSSVKDKLCQSFQKHARVRHPSERSSEINNCQLPIPAHGAKILKPSSAHRRLAAIIPQVPALRGCRELQSLRSVDQKSALPIKPVVLT